MFKWRKPIIIYYLIDKVMAGSGKSYEENKKGDMVESGAE
jgi:hypothetical protein